MHAPFQKLSSVSTDGGSNMIGRTNGMVTHLRRMVQEECGSHTGNFHQMWCLCHRLNLVIRDFQNVENIKTVFEFCDWFTAKRKAVIYRKWLKHNSPDDFFPKIPTPSETRWSFYKDVLDSVLAQKDQIEEFLVSEGDVVPFIGRFGLSQTGTQTSRSFFQNKYILSHFLFARFVLRKICSVNQQLQEQFSVLPFAWIVVDCLKKDLSKCLGEIKARHFEQFSFIRNIESEKKQTFENVLQSCLVNMDIRFPYPSVS